MPAVDPNDPTQVFNPIKPFAALKLELGDANANGRADMAVTLDVAGKEYGPVVIDLPHGEGLSLITSVFDGVKHGPIGIAAGVVGALLPRIANAFGGSPLAAVVDSVIEGKRAAK